MSSPVGRKGGQKVNYELTLDDVRDYLMDTNALKEAEMFLLNTKREEERAKELTTRQLANRSKDTSIDGVRNRMTKKNVQEQRDNLINSLVSEKHAGRLGVMREEEEIRELRMLEVKLRDQNFAMERERANIASEVQRAKRSQLDAIEKQAENDLMLLESQRQATLKEMDKKQSMIENLRKDLRAAEADIETASMRPTATQANASLRLSQSEANTPADRLKAMVDLSSDHAQRLAQARADSLSAEEELKRLDQGLWTSSSSSSAAAQGQGALRGSSEMKASSSVQDIIDALTTGDGLKEQQRRLEQMKAEAQRERNQFAQDAGFQSLEAATAGGGGGVPESLERRDGSLRDCLDDWLTEGATGVPVARSDERPADARSTRAPLLSSSSPSLAPASAPGSAPAPSSSSSALGPGLASVRGGAWAGAAAEPTAASSSSKPGPRDRHGAALPSSSSSSSLIPQPSSSGPGAGLDPSSLELIQSLQEEVRRLRDDQKQQQQQQQQQQQFAAQNPYGAGYGQPFGHPGMFPPPPLPLPLPLQHHALHTNPYMQMSPYAMFQPQPQPQPDPVQAQLAQQMQRMAEQMERENARLLAQIGGGGVSGGGGGGGGGMDPFNGYNQGAGGMGGRGGGGGMGGGRSLGADPFVGPQGDYSSSSSDQGGAKRGRRDPTVSKLEQKYQDDIRLMQLEYERLKQQQELEDFRYQMDRQRAQRSSEDEHNEWLTKQKQDLQALKMKQALAKEQRLLQAHVGDQAGDTLLGSPRAWGEESPFPSVKQQGGRGGGPSAVLREEAGCGGVKLPVDLSKGVSLVADGLLLPPEGHQDDLWRVALGVYDAKGKPVTKLAASEWQPWSDATGNRALANLVAQAGSVKRIVKAAKGDEPPSIVLGLRALAEIQCRTVNGPQRSVGWAAFPLVFQDGGGAKYLQTGLWRAPMRKGPSDPAFDPAAKREDASKKDEAIYPNTWVLLRVGDIDAAASQYSFSPQTHPALSNDQNLLDCYQDLQGSGSGGAGGGGDEYSRGDDLSGGTPQDSRPSSRLDGAGGQRNSRRGERPGTGQGQGQGGLPPIFEESTKIGGGDEDDGLPGDVVGPSSKPQREDKVPWLLGTPVGPATVKYQRGDGIDIYIDAAQFLPDNCTATRLVLKVFAMDKEPMFNPPSGIVGECVSAPAAQAKSPVYKFKVELRNSNFNTTATALIRVDTIDCSTLLPVSVGYVCFKLFCGRDRSQPRTANASDCFINTGSFQLPIHAGRPGGLESYDENMLMECNGGKGLPRIPCASLLVRILGAPRSQDGLAVLSRDDYAREEWAGLGLDVPAPSYASGAYFGGRCQPTDDDKICFSAKTEVPVLVEASLSQAMASRTEALPPGITPKPQGAQESELASWMGSLFPADMRRIIDLSYAVPYSIDKGVQVSVDMLFGMPEAASGLFSSAPSLMYKVVYSIVPPGLFYKDPPLSEGVRFTKTENLDRPSRAPVFLDGFSDFTPSQMDETSYLVLDVRTVRIDPPKTKLSEAVDIVVEPAVMEKSWWTMLPLAKERTPGQGFRYVASGTFQIPLVRGAVPSGLFSSENPLNELLDRLGSKGRGSGSLKLSDGASVLVRIVNPLLRGLFEDSDPRTDFTTKPPEAPNNLQTLYHTRLLGTAAQGVTGRAGAAPEKFAFDAVKAALGKSTLAQLPKDQDPRKLSKDVSKKFAVTMGIDIQA